MIRDASNLEDGARIEADLCIVGAGAAGLSVALQFLHTRTRVLLVESGRFEADPATQALYEGEVADPALHSPPDRYRQRRFGGSTTIWGGRCMPFDPIDFEARPWMPGSGWPFGFDELRPYYVRANRLCEAGEFAYTADLAVPGGMRPTIPGFASRSVSDDTLERFSCPTDFGRRYRHRIAASRNVTVLLGANATEIRTDASGDVVAAVALATLDGRRFTVHAAEYVLAAGGLETPRLLLASRGVHADGIGNAHDLVGRHYMCHVAGTAGDLALASPARSVHHGYEVAADGTYCRRRLAVRPEAQRELGIGNVVGRLHHPRIPDPAHRTGALSALFLARSLIPYEYAKRLTGDTAPGRGSRVRHVANVLADPFGTAGFLLHWLRHRTLAERKFPSVIIRPRASLFSIDFHAEQEPNPASRVMLARGVDALGLPKLRVDWRYTAGDLRTVSEFFRLLAGEITSGGHGTLRYSPDELADACIRDGAYGGHHIGTARMSASSRKGVVDPECRVHGVRNLHLAGSTVFPTSSQANPTLTIVALSLRLADRLQARLDEAAAHRVPVRDVVNVGGSSPRRPSSRSSPATASA